MRTDEVLEYGTLVLGSIIVIHMLGFWPFVGIMLLIYSQNVACQKFVIGWMMRMIQEAKQEKSKKDFGR